MKRINLHSIKVTGDSGISEADVASKFPEFLAEITEEEAYLPEQLFNIDWR